MKTFTFLCGFMIAAICIQGQQIHVPEDYPSIQGAIIAASPGDTIIVSDGTYYEQIDFMGKKPLMVASEFLLDGNYFHILNTKIDGSQIGNGDNGSIVYFVSNEDTTSVLCGFTIQNGNKGTVITGLNGEPARAGGAIHVSASGAKIIHNRIINNHLIHDLLPEDPWSLHGAGIFCDWVEEDNWLIMDHNTFDNNSVEVDFMAAGAGAAFISYNAIITDNYFLNNTAVATEGAYSYSGALTCATDPSWNLAVFTLIKGNTFKNNEVSSETNFANGGAILAVDYECVFSDNTFESNTAYGSQGEGGGIYLSNPKEGSLVSNNVFDGNISNWRGGGLLIEYEVPVFPNTAVLLAENNIFTNNEAFLGGGLFVYDKPFILQNNVFSGNTAINSGGAVSFEQALIPVKHIAVMMNNSFSENKSFISGGAVHCGNGNPLIVNSIFSQDSSNVGGGPEIYLASTQDTVELANCDIDLTMVYGNKIDGGGNINEDPQFDDPELLTLLLESPCIDAGTEYFTCICGDTYYPPDFDILGTIRPQDDGYEIGAYEIDVVGLSDPKIPVSNSISCYPNPCRDILNIEFSLLQGQKITLKIFDNRGKEVAVVVNGYFTKGDSKVAYDVSDLPAGVYYYRFYGEGNFNMGKIAVAR